MPITPKTLDFLAENRIQNSRVWYQEHKPQYQEFVLEPLKELAGRLEPVMLNIDPLLVTEPKVDRTISRIYRDTRFSKDKSLYREVMWCAYERNKKEFPDMPGFFFEFSPDGFRYGCGYYQAPARLMQAARELILEKNPIFTKVFEAMERQTEFQLEGAFYKRSKFPDQPEELRQWLDRKNLDLIHNSKDFTLLFSDTLWETLAQGFQRLAPFYRFLCRAREQTIHKEGE